MKLDSILVLAAAAISFWVFVFLKRKRYIGEAKKKGINPIIPISIGGFSLLAGIILMVTGSSIKSDVYDSMEWKMMNQLPPGGASSLETATVLSILGIVLLVAAVGFFSWGAFVLYKANTHKNANRPQVQYIVPPVPQTQYPSQPAGGSTVTPVLEAAPIEEKLKKIEKLRAENLITEEEYQQKRKEYINML